MAFLKQVYGRAKDRHIPHITTASPEAHVEDDGGFVVWDICLSIVCAVTDAEYQNRIIFHNSTLNLPVVVQQSHPDPKYALHTAARHVSGPSRTSMGMS